MQLAPRPTIPAERPAGFWSRLVVRSVWLTAGPTVRFVFRMRIVNAPTIDGAHVIVANHTSFLDPLLLGAAIGRPVTFLMTIAVFRSALLGWFYRAMRAIPLGLRGSGNRDALRAARSVLQRGERLAVFPEGGISRDGVPMLGNPGAVSLVLGQNVPIVPAFLDGARAALPAGARMPRLFTRVTVCFGDPIPHHALGGGDDTPRRERLALATHQIMDSIARLGGTVSRESWLRDRAVASSRHGAIDDAGASSIRT